LSPRSRLLLALAVGVVVVASAGAVFYKLGQEASKPPSGPVDNFVIIASVTGYNDSIGHGVPANPWPVLHATRGDLVNITVSNDDKQAHGFQVAHYLASPIETIAPGQKVVFSFVADESGTFQIYCDIPCTVHWAMQSGELIVS
jgi:FtsP/CotA-like multicopper oxidase with cupredoxin domain